MLFLRKKYIFNAIKNHYICTIRRIYFCVHLFREGFQASFFFFPKLLLRSSYSLVKAMGFSHVWMRELDYKESWGPNCREIQPVHPKGSQSWIFIGRTDAETETPIVWPPDAKNWLSWKDLDAGKDWRREEKGTIENELVGWHHQLNGHEFE